MGIFGRILSHGNVLSAIGIATVDRGGVGLAVHLCQFTADCRFIGTINILVGTLHRAQGVST